jgi:hypothetical protein
MQPILLRLRNHAKTTIENVLSNNRREYQQNLRALIHKYTIQKFEKFESQRNQPRIGADEESHEDGKTAAHGRPLEKY